MEQDIEGTKRDKTIGLCLLLEGGAFQREVSCPIWCTEFGDFDNGKLTFSYTVNALFFTPNGVLVQFEKIFKNVISDK